MNHWARMLEELSPTLQRVIARSQRISLPRRCDTTERIARLRQSLCHRTTVRETYLMLDTQTQNALQDLRHQRGGLAAELLEQTYGMVRSASELAADPHAQTISERLLLLGWLLPRPATRHHRAHYIIPPEVRRWLPAGLHLPALRAAAPATVPPALRAVGALIVLAQHRPLNSLTSGRLSAATLRTIVERLTPYPAVDAVALTQFLIPLLVDLGVLVRTAKAYAATPAGAHFLDLSPQEQLARIQKAWFAAIEPDAWLRPLLASAAGIDWPCLRRRLWAWGTALPGDTLLELSTLYPALEAALGPLANAQTHGFRHVNRVPWQPRRARTIFNAALHGPLYWLGCVTWHASTTGEEQWCSGIPASTALQLPSRPWHYGLPGALIIPHAATNAALLRILPFLQWHTADADETTYLVTPATLAHATSEGWNSATFWELVEIHAGSVPPDWRQELDRPIPTVHIEHGAVVLADPDTLACARQDRTVRRYLSSCIAPGVALVQQAAIAPLTRALQRRHLAAICSPPPTTPIPHDLDQGEAATLLVASAFYRRYAPADAPLVPDHTLIACLHARLTPALREATTTTIAALPPPRIEGADREDEPLPEPMPLPSDHGGGTLALSGLEHQVSAVTQTYGGEVAPILEAVRSQMSTT